MLVLEGGEPLGWEVHTNHDHRHRSEYASRFWIHRIEQASRNTNFRLRVELALRHLSQALLLYAMNQHLVNMVWAQVRFPNQKQLSSMVGASFP